VQTSNKPDAISTCVSSCKAAQAAGSDVACRFDQCGGRDGTGAPWLGATQCEPSTSCTVFSDDYSQCLGVGESALSSPPPPPPPVAAPADFMPTGDDSSCRAIGQQCGGNNWQGPSCCKGLGQCSVVRPVLCCPCCCCAAVGEAVLMKFEIPAEERLQQPV